MLSLHTTYATASEKLAPKLGFNLIPEINHNDNHFDDHNKDIFIHMTKLY